MVLLAKKREKEGHDPNIVHSFAKKTEGKERKLTL